MILTYFNKKAQEMDVENKRWEEDRAWGLEKVGQIHSTEIQHACRVQMDELGTKTKKIGALCHSV